MHIWVSSFIHGDTLKRKKILNQLWLEELVEPCFVFFFFFCSNCCLELINFIIFERKNSAYLSKTYFLLKTFSARFHPSRNSLFTKFLQKYGSSILNVLNIDENSLRIQTAINILDQFRSSLCRKNMWKGLNTLLNSNIHSLEPYLEPSWTSTTLKVVNDFCAKSSTVHVQLGSKHSYGCTILFIIVRNLTKF